MNPYLKSQALYKQAFKGTASDDFFSPGRLEIIGNHTDHQRGHCLVGGCSLGIYGSSSPSQDNFVSFISDGYGTLAISLEDLTPKNEEKFTSSALVKGVLVALAKMGYKIGGFKAAIYSTIFPGAGVSSSAAYELFIAEAINHYYNDDKISRLDLAKASQFAENVYFGKASGLLDQCGSSFGGLQFLDFKDASNPLVEPLQWPKSWDLRIVLVNPGASHAGLSDLYSEMPLDMKEVAAKMFGEEVLSQVNPDTFYGRINSNKYPNISERAKKRALHYFEEDARTLRAKQAILSENEEWFLELERSSELSQSTLLMNAMIPGHYEGSPLEAIDRARSYLKKGASRVMGGGLVGSTINFVPESEFNSFYANMVSLYGNEGVVEVTIPNIGAHFIK